MIAPTHITDWSIPNGDPADWDLEQETYASFLANAFAKEYVFDFVGYKAVMRLGCGENQATAIARKLLGNQYVQKYIKKYVDRFASDKNVNENTLLALLWKEANDEIHGTASSRVNAAEKLAKMTGLVNDKMQLDINVGDRSFVDTPITKKEFEDMKEVFDNEY